MPTRIKVSDCHTISHPVDTNFYSTNYYTTAQIRMLKTDVFVKSAKEPSQVLKATFGEYRRNIRRSKQPQWMSHKYALEAFQPRNPPYVPSFIVFVVNNIEQKCNDRKSHDFWLSNYAWNDNDMQRARANLQYFMTTKLSLKELNTIIRELPLTVQTCMLKEFFTLLPRKLLHIEQKHFTQLSAKPLYDSLLRVNPQLKSIVKHAVIRMSRIRMDTLSFMMTHVLHLWEYTESPHISKTIIAEIYGPWILKLEDKVSVSDHCGVQSGEALLLLAMMDATDPAFWNTFSTTRIAKLFRILTPFEHKRFLKSLRVWDDGSGTTVTPTSTYSHLLQERVDNKSHSLLTESLRSTQSEVSASVGMKVRRSLDLSERSKKLPNYE